MRLIYISNARIPTEKAHGIHIMKMCEAFAKIAEVELIIPARSNKIKDDPFDYYGIKRNFKIKKVLCWDWIQKDFTQRNKCLRYIVLWLESLSFTLFAFFYLLFKKADIIYIRDKTVLPIIVLKYFSPFIFEFHTFSKSPRRYFLYRPFLAKLKALVVITQKLKEFFREKGIGPDKILVAPDGVDLKMFDIQCSKFEARQKLNLPQDKKIAIYAGHLYEWKGAQILAEAPQFLPENTEVYFVGGTTEDVRKLEILNSKFETVHVVGHKPHQEIPYWLKAADVLVLPNSGKEEISKYWTSPLKMFEYMASKRPIVSSDLPSIREILNEENAILIEPDNPEALARGIKKALEDKLLSDKISERAFLDVQQYTWLKRAGRIINFIKNNEK